MKKVFALLFSFLLVLSFCSCKDDNVRKVEEGDLEAFVGAGEITMLNTLVNSNAFFVENVFIANHLPVDTKNLITNEQGTFAPVVSEEIKSYADLKNKLSSTYTEEVVQKLLNSPVKYTEINGKLCFNMAYDKETEPSSDWSNPEISAKISQDGKYAITATVKDSNGKENTLTMSASNINGNIKLDNIYS